MSPASMGSKHTLQTSLDGAASGSRNITVTSSTATSASRRSEIEKRRLLEMSLDRDPSTSSSSSLTRGPASRRKSSSVVGSMSMRAAVACSRCQMSLKRGGWMLGNGWRLCMRNLQLVSDMQASLAAWMPKTSDTRSILRKTLGDSLQEGQCFSGYSRVPLTWANGVVMVTGNSTQTALRSCLASLSPLLGATGLPASTASRRLSPGPSLQAQRAPWSAAPLAGCAAFGHVKAWRVLPLMTPYFHSGTPFSSLRPLNVKRSARCEASWRPSWMMKVSARQEMSSSRSASTVMLFPLRFLTKS
mmetsp:Transcript_43342/g.137859  ORF Transcript_43342/g.137859 Transcript_43342/m.137859 type:complete len:302 (-) Transcript_43342:173-1078(-)